MIYGDIQLGADVNIDPSTSINHVQIGDCTKIAKRCSIYGSEQHPLVIGESTIIAMNTILNGYSASLTLCSEESCDCYPPLELSQIR